MITSCIIKFDQQDCYRRLPYIHKASKSVNNDSSSLHFILQNDEEKAELGWRDEVKSAVLKYTQHVDFAAIFWGFNACLAVNGTSSAKLILHRYDRLTLSHESTVGYTEYINGPKTYWTENIKDEIFIELLDLFNKRKDVEIEQFKWIAVTKTNASETSPIDKFRSTRKNSDVMEWVEKAIVYCKRELNKKSMEIYADRLDVIAYKKSLQQWIDTIKNEHIINNEHAATLTGMRDYILAVYKRTPSFEDDPIGYFYLSSIRRTTLGYFRFLFGKDVDLPNPNE